MGERVGVLGIGFRYLILGKGFKQWNSNLNLNSSNQKIMLQHECNN
jgi:hypothetical protein